MQNKNTFLHIMHRVLKCIYVSGVVVLGMMVMILLRESLKFIHDFHKKISKLSDMGDRVA